jgi:hypothetical protein
MTGELAERIAATAALGLGIALLVASPSALLVIAAYPLAVYGLGWYALRAAAPHPGRRVHFDRIDYLRSRLRARSAPGDARPLTRPASETAAPDARPAVSAAAPDEGPASPGGTAPVPPVSGAVPLTLPCVQAAGWAE